MNKDLYNFIECNYEQLKNICKKITCNNELSDDLLHEILIQLLEKDNMGVIDKEDIKWYVIRVIQLNWHSKTSPFYYKIRKENLKYVELNYVNDVEDENTNMEREELMTKVEEEFSNLDWFHKQLFEQYLVLGSLRKLNLATKIPIASLSRYIRESKEIIKSNIKN